MDRKKERYLIQVSTTIGNLGMNMDYFVDMNMDHLAFGPDPNLMENQIAVSTDFELKMTSHR